jgi:hypothetical protein
VDLLRLDVGGSEMEALAGARKTIVHHLPTLAVALYHTPNDLLTIPAFLDDLPVELDLFLDDVTLNCTGTVLFARPRAGTRGSLTGEHTINASERRRTIGPRAARRRGLA